MRTLVFFNHAGGVSKTSSTRDIGYTLARDHQLRVLLIDVDPQANLSSWLGVPQVPDERTVLGTLLRDEPLPEPYAVHGLRLIASNLWLASAEAQLPGVVGGFAHLRQQVRRLHDQYDLVLIDSPPSLGQLSLAAAVAADGLVVPVPTTHKGVGGIAGVLKMIETYRKLNPGLHVAWYLPTQHNPHTLHHREALAWMQGNLSPLGSPISYRPAIYPDAHAQSLPVGAYQPGSPADLEVKRATTELLAALDLGVVHGQ
ncbi:ParA family protein [Deinococcus peraridilitoris]|uniref:ATPase involved in chromosome partitioning n=1 Tax=Deinococcus peraridilitoris (strain DSM 19664 / LMG 22246 / CIP 109416 / KR-200) TaxID=937777 RepID=L0A7U4_DEIPD|nr:ParA family protein [Deinococcus peraridilitoris]AFZ69252.1 ATPase involved in chromosome partitioning [Deinococcus peraridilitoris DSM 19664]